MRIRMKRQENVLSRHRKNSMLENHQSQAWCYRVAMTSWSHSKKTRWGSLQFKKSSTSTKKLELSLWSYPKNLHIVIFQNSYSSFLGILPKFSQFSVTQAAKSIFFLWLYGSEWRIFLWLNWFLTGLGLTLDFPRLIISETSGYVHFQDRNHHPVVLNKTTLHRIHSSHVRCAPSLLCG